uniref:Ycf80 n=1 Tax=Osmundea sinicola TaxID=290685 RepID=A0A7L4WNM5_9FLOR|nr:hypothetical protein [Osmundea sinicola]QFR99854.1 hypothetical protein [Osmundea sinicola]
MILFDFSLFDLVSRSDYNNNPFLKLRLGFSDNEVINSSNLFNLSFKDNKFKSILLSVNRILVNQLEQESVESKSSDKLISRNFWQRLINKYWQETIFISSPTIDLENYTKKLRASGLSVYENSDYKYFLQQFSKDLLNKKIDLNLTIYNNKYMTKSKKNQNLSVQYKWLKSLNPTTFLFKFGKHNMQSNVLIDDKVVSFPLFVLVNDKQQVVLSESSEQLQSYNKLWYFYSNLTNKKALYTGLFFTNLDDANEYLNYINLKYKRSTRIRNIKLVPTTIKMYYQLLSQVNQNIDFRLVPDLKEISELLYQYKKYRHICFNDNQKYGSNYFQGQPLYFVKSYKLKKINKFNDMQSSDKASYNRKFQYEAVFLNYETAINAWRNYKRQFSADKLHSNPRIDVWNLESFITSNNYTKKSKSFIFIPSTKTYEFTKQYIKSNLEDNKALTTSLSHYSIHLKSFMYRIFWSLTTRQPISW